MNNKGFTLVELLAVLVLLGIILGIIIPVLGINMDETKKDTEEVFVDTIKDSLNMYLTSRDAKSLSFNIECSNKLEKTHGDVKVYKGKYVVNKNTGETRNTNFLDVINSEYKPITQDDLVNPADDSEDNNCANASDIEITIYRDDDYVNYYSVNKSEFSCLKNIGYDSNNNITYDTVITNLPEGFSCE